MHFLVKLFLTFLVHRVFGGSRTLLPYTDPTYVNSFHEFSTFSDEDIGSFIVNFANQQMGRRTRLILMSFHWEKSVDFMNSLLRGHNVPVISQFSPVSPERINEINQLKFYDVVHVLGSMEYLVSYASQDTFKYDPGARILLVTFLPERAIRGIVDSTYRRSRASNTMALLVGSDSLKIYKWKAYGKIGECGNPKTMEFIEKITDTNKSTTVPILFDGTLPSLQGCMLTVTTNDVPPYVTKNSKSGIEIGLLNILTKYFHFDFVFKNVPPEENFWAVKDSKGRLSGVFKMLFSLETDLAFAAISARPDRYKIGIALYPYTYENKFWIVPAPTMGAIGTNLWNTFTPELWWLLSLAIFLSGIVMTLGSDKSLGESLNYFTAVQYTGIPPSVPKRTSLRLLTLFMVIFSMHVFVAFRCVLLHMLTVKHEGVPFKLLKEVQKAGLTCYIFNDFFNTEDSFLDMCEKASYVTPILNEIAYNRSAYLLYPEGLIMYNISGTEYHDDDSRRLLKVLHKPFGISPLSLYMSPGNILAQHFDVKIQQIVEAGLILFWKNWITQNGRRLNNVLFHDNHHHGHGLDHDDDQPLSMANLLIAFKIWEAFLCAAVAGFVLEIVFYALYTKVNWPCALKFERNG